MARLLHDEARAGVALCHRIYCACFPEGSNSRRCLEPPGSSLPTGSRHQDGRDPCPLRRPAPSILGPHPIFMRRRCPTGAWESLPALLTRPCVVKEAAGDARVTRGARTVGAADEVRGTYCL